MDSTTSIALISSVAAAAGVAVALVVGLMQVRAARVHARQERVLHLHESLTSGELGQARDRLSTLLWELGHNVEPTKCWIPTFEELLGPPWVPAASLVKDASKYHRPDETGFSPMHDYFSLLWGFERVNEARLKGLLDEVLLAKMIGHHAIWWDLLSTQVKDGDAHTRPSLRNLAEWAARRLPPPLLNYGRQDFVTHLLPAPRT